MGILRGHRGLAVASIALGFVSLCFAQSSSPSLIRQPIDESQLVTLRGNTHPLARAQFDIGTASPDLQLNRMLLVQGRLRRHSVAPGHSYIDQCGNHDNNGKYNRKRRDSSPREHASSMPKAAAAGSVENYL